MISSHSTRAPVRVNDSFLSSNPASYTNIMFDDVDEEKKKREEQQQLKLKQQPKKNNKKTIDRICVY